MIYRIYYDNKKRKFATRVKNREELILLRNAQQNLDYLDRVRKGDQTAKPHLLQLAYNMGHVEGALAGCKSIGSYFFHDVDCYDEEHSKQTKELILEKKDEIGLRMLERSASGGWHLVCERRRGTTILENQVRVATVLKVEMDTGAKDLQRVAFSTSGSDDDLPYLDDCLFTEPMSAEECEAEYELLRERQRRGEEDVPAGAKKANKHYRPWEEAAEKPHPGPPLKERESMEKGRLCMVCAGAPKHYGYGCTGECLGTGCKEPGLQASPLHLSLGLLGFYIYYHALKYFSNSRLRSVLSLMMRRSSARCCSFCDPGIHSFMYPAAEYFCCM